jgi:hypothetical protein
MPDEDVLFLTFIDPIGDGTAIFSYSSRRRLMGWRNPSLIFYISYMNASKEYRTFGLDGINPLIVLLFERLAIVKDTIEEVELDWYNEFFESEDENRTLLKRRALM